MNASSQLVASLAQGVILDVTLEDLHFRAYVVISEPDISLVAQFVPRSQFEQDGDVHVTAVELPEEARTQVQDISFNMNPGDAAVFLCRDELAWTETLQELGHRPMPS
jgi:hypothetical protein